MIRVVEVQLYGAGGNNAVVRMPERRNPGVVVQADTLRSLATDARDIAERLKMGAAGVELADDAEALAERLVELFDTLKAELERARETLRGRIASERALWPILSPSSGSLGRPRITTYSVGRDENIRR